MEPVQIEEKPIIKEINEPYTWTKSKIISVKNKSLRYSELKTGCGILQIQGVAYFAEKEYKTFKSLMDTIVQETKEEASSFICTLGSQYFKSKPHLHNFIINYGFKEISEYKNSKHRSGIDTQRLYQLITE